MRSTLSKTAVAAVAVAAMIAVPSVALAHDDDSSNSSNSSRSLTVIGLAGGGTQLVSFAADRPQRAKGIGTVTGLTGDTLLVGIDYRVQDGLLYGLGNAGGIYTLETGYAVATKVGQFTVALQGASFGVDFNPAANALRVISDTGQNLRHPFAGALAGQTQVDASLNYPPAVATGVTGAAYTNNDLDPNTATTLFDIDTTLDQVAIQSTANSGVLAPTGKLTVDAGADAGFDIYSRLRDGRTVDVTGFASLTVGRVNSFYRVNIITGEVRSVGDFKTPVTDVAVPLAQR